MLVRARWWVDVRREGGQGEMSCDVGVSGREVDARCGGRVLWDTISGCGPNEFLFGRSSGV